MAKWVLPYRSVMKISRFCVAISLIALTLSGCASSSLTAAKIHLEEGRLEKARSKVLQAVAQNPNAESYVVLGQIQAAGGEYAAMDSAFASAAALDAGSLEWIAELRNEYWVIEYNRGVEQLSEDPPNHESAERFFRNAVLIEPERLESWRNLAYTAHHTGKPEDAIFSYEQILEGSPADSASLSSLGTLYLNQNRHVEAIGVLLRLVELMPQNVEVHLNLGVAYENSNRIEEARAAYEQAIELAPESGAGYYNLGNLLWSQKSYDGAIVAYESAVERDPDDNNALYNLAICYLSVGDAHSALPVLTELSERMPDNTLIWRELGRIHALQGRLEESQRAYDQAEL